MHHPILIQKPADIDPALQRLQQRKLQIEHRRVALEAILRPVDLNDPDVANTMAAAVKCILKRAQWEATDYMEMEKALQEQIDQLLQMKFGPHVVRQ